MKLNGPVVAATAVVTFVALTLLGAPLVVDATSGVIAIFGSGGLLGYLLGHRHGREPRNMEARVVRDELDVPVVGRAARIEAVAQGSGAAQAVAAVERLRDAHVLARVREENRLLDAWKIEHSKELRMRKLFHEHNGSVADEYWERYKTAGKNAARLLDKLMDMGIDPLAVDNGERGLAGIFRK